MLEGNRNAFMVLMATGALGGCILWCWARRYEPNWTPFSRILVILGTIFVSYCTVLLVLIYGVTLESFALPIISIGLGRALLCPLLLRRVGSKAVQLTLTAFILMVLVSTALSVYQATAIPGEFYRRTGLVTALACGTLFLSTLAVFRRKDEARRLIYALILGACAASLVGLLQFLFPTQMEDFFFRDLRSDPRPPGTLGQTNWFGTYLCLLFPLAVVGAIGADALASRMVWLSSVALMFAAVLAAQTRGAYVAVVFFLVWMLLRQFRLWRRMVSPFAVMLVITLVLLPVREGEIWNRIASLEVEVERAADGAPGTGSGRFWFWTYALQKMPPYLLTGSGFDTYLLVADEGENKPKLNKAHSIYFEYALTIGLPGLFLYLAFIWACGRPSKRFARQDLWSWGFRASVLTYLVQGIFIHDTIQVWPILWLILGLAVAWKREADSEPTPR